MCLIPGAALKNILGSSSPAPYYQKTLQFEECTLFLTTDCYIMSAFSLNTVSSWTLNKWNGEPQLQPLQRGKVIQPGGLHKRCWTIAVKPRCHHLNPISLRLAHILKVYETTCCTEHFFFSFYMPQSMKHWVDM